jgi:arginine utilization regulatory protein
VGKNLSECFHLLTDNAPYGMIITNINDVVIYINPTAQRLLNYHENGKVSLSSIIPTDDIRNQTGQRKTLNYNNKTLSVNVKTVNSGGTPVFLWYISDISKTEQLTDKLYCLETILDNIDEGIIMTDTENKITIYNKPYSNFEGLPQTQVIGKHLDYIYASNQHTTVLKTGVPITDVYKIYSTIDGKKIDGMGKTLPVIKDNKVIAVFSVVRNVEKVRSLLQKTIQLQEKLINKIHSNGTKYTFKSIIGDSKVMIDTINKARTVATSPSPVWIYGETGTGKELFAQSIHNSGPNADEPFVAINCAAVPESLFESILFGSVKGAFTGAQNLQGVFEQAGNGTLFLDEINSMPKAMQAKLLRVLQEKHVRRVGATYEIPVKCRIITSSNEKPETCVEKGTLRKDLYYRLSVLRINIPPLRERGKDVELLAEHFLTTKSQLYGKQSINLSCEFINYLYQHHWPGNVRELEHTIESCVAMIEDEEELQLHHLPSYLRRTITDQNRCQTTSTNNHPLYNVKETTLADALRDVEKKMILNSLQNHKWNISRAARAIGIGRQNLQYRMNKLKIKKPCQGCNITGKQ